MRVLAEVHTSDPGEHASRTVHIQENYQAIRSTGLVYQLQFDTKMQHMCVKQQAWQNRRVTQSLTGTNAQGMGAGRLDRSLAAG